MSIPASVRLLVGGYTPPMGNGHGIGLIARTPDGLTDLGLLTLTESPSYLVNSADGSSVYAVNETEQGRVSTFRWLDRDSPEPALRLQSVQSTGGAHPCHLALHPSGRLLAVANYTSGSVAMHPLNPDGSIRPLAALLQLRGSGPVPIRQDAARAHQVTFDRNELAVVDLGSDRVWRYRVSLSDDGEVTTDELEPLVLKPGTGPRQLLAVGSRAYVLGELDASLTVASWPDRPVPLGTIAIAANPSGSPDELGAALISGPQPDLMYASLYGSNRISVIRSGDSGPQVIGDFAAGGDSPRHLCLVRAELFVANQASSSIACVSIDAATGLPSGRVDTVDFAGPSCLVPVPT